MGRSMPSCAQEDERVKKGDGLRIKAEGSCGIAVEETARSKNHEAVTMTRDILNGEVIDILPRSK